METRLAADRHLPNSTPNSRPRSLHRRTAAFRLILVAAGALQLPEEAAGECASLTSTGVVLGESIGLEARPGTPRRVLERAVDRWQSCFNYGTGFPRFVLDGAASRSVSVRWVAGSSGSRRCGSFVGSTITLYGQALDPEGRPRLCADADVNLAHELGHVLGLADQHDQRSCGTTIMAQSPERRLDRRQVTPQECRALSARWIVGTRLAGRGSEWNQAGESR